MKLVLLKNNRKMKKIILTINNRILLVGPSFLGKTSLLLETPSRTPNRDIYINTKSPLEQYSNSKIKVKENTEQIKLLH